MQTTKNENRTEIRNTIEYVSNKIDNVLAVLQMYVDRVEDDADIGAVYLVRDSLETSVAMLDNLAESLTEEIADTDIKWLSKNVI